MEILRIARQNESLTRSFSPPQCGQAFLPVHLASNTGGTWLTTFSIAKSRKPIKNLSTGLSLLFFGRKTKAALVGIPTLLGMPIFLSRRYAPVFEEEPRCCGRPCFYPSQKPWSLAVSPCGCSRYLQETAQRPFALSAGCPPQGSSPLPQPLSLAFPPDLPVAGAGPQKHMTPA